MREAALIADELKGVRELYAKNLVQLSRLSALEREAASLEGQRGQLVAGVAQSEGKIAETKLQIIQVDEETARRGDEGAARDPGARCRSSSSAASPPRIS